MDKFKTSVMTAFLLPALLASAQLEGLTGNQGAVGYTMTDEITYRDVMFGTAGTYTVGALLPASMLSDYKGCKVIGIRVAVSKDLGRTSFVLNSRTENGTNQLITQKQRLYEGWNNVFFNSFDYEINATEDLFYGFEYTETDDMVSAESGALCSTGDYDEENSFVLYDDGMYYQLTGARKLCVQLIVDLSSMPAHRMTLGFFDYGFKYKKVGENLEIYSVISNTGRDKVDNFRVACRIDDLEPMYEFVESPVGYGQNATIVKTFDISSLSVGGHELYVYVDQVNGEEYADGINRGKGAKFAIYSESLPRNAAFLEVYADQQESHTAQLDASLKQAGENLGDKMIVVKNFRPGNPLAIEDGAYLHDLYAYTWPSFTINRSHFPGEMHVAYDVNQYIDQVPILIPTMLEDMVNQDLTTPSFAGISVNAVIEDGRLLTVKTEGDVLGETESIYGNVALTLMLLEDDVVSSQQTTTLSKNYSHSDVLRAYLTPATGVIVDASSGKYIHELTVTLPESFNADKLSVVGILTQAGQPTSDTLYDFDVINAAMCGVENHMSGVRDLSMPDAVGQPVYYTLDGRRVMPEDMEKGIYVRVNADGSRVKVIN